MIYKITKRDWILIIVIMAVVITFTVIHRLDDKTDEKMVLIRLDGEVVSQTELSDDQTITVNGGTNIIKIENNQAFMSEADCPDHLCIRQGAVSRNNESIICLPNKVVVEIKSAESNDFDIVAK